MVFFYLINLNCSAFLINTEYYKICIQILEGFWKLSFPWDGSWSYIAMLLIFLSNSRYKFDFGNIVVLNITMTRSQITPWALLRYRYWSVEGFRSWTWLALFVSSRTLMWLLYYNSITWINKIYSMGCKCKIMYKHRANCSNKNSCTFIVNDFIIKHDYHNVFWSYNLITCKIKIWCFLTTIDKSCNLFKSISIYQLCCTKSISNLQFFVYLITYA